MSIPIVFTGGGDPVKLGLVASLSRPGGNATGVVNIAAELTAKRMQLLRELVPNSAVMAALFNPVNPATEAQLKEVTEAARAIGQEILVVRASSERELSAAFVALVKGRAGSLYVGADPLFMNQRTQLAALAARHAIPASYAFRDLVVAGGLMSYGANLPDVYRQAGVYAGRILKGARPADLPVL